MIAIFRIGTHIPTPFVDPERVREFFGESSGRGIFSMVNMFTGGGFSKMSVMSLGIMPYISAQIILQILALVWPYLEKLKKEGEAGQRKIEQMSRYGTVILSSVQGFGLALWMIKERLVMPALANAQILGFIPGNFLFAIVAMLSIAAGTTLLMWIGERITANGVGNGISLIIALGIVASYPAAAVIFWNQLQSDLPKIWLPIIVGLCIFTTVVIILIQEGARKIPIQHARRTMGRRVVQSQTNYLPLKVNTAGVIPVIFSSAILTLPMTVFGWIGAGQGDSMFTGLSAWISPNSPYNLYNAFDMQKGSVFMLLKMMNVYTVLYVLLTAFFCFFYTAVTFNPQDVADNLKKAGAFVPGYRPGKQTADYIDMVLTRITTVGAFFLVFVALIPQFLNGAFNVHYFAAEFAGGTGLIIVVGVVLDTMKRIESQLLMRHYEGFKIRRQAGAGGRGETKRWSGRTSSTASK